MSENKTYVSATKAWAKPTTFFETLPIHKIQDTTLARFVAKAGLELNKIQLTGAVQITDNGIEVLVRSCPNLTSVNLSGCGNVTDAGVLFLTERCQKLQSLLLSGIAVSDHALAILSVNNHGMLREIDLSCCRPSGEPNLSNVVLMEASSAYCLITDGGLMKLAEGCPQLESISLAFCRTITGLGISHMAQHCPRLVSLNLSECYLISDDGFCAIAQRCQGLQIAELSNCPGLSNAAVQQLLKLPLRSLNVSGCSDITDGSFSGVHCPTLERINVNNVGSLTDAILTSMSDGCPALKEIELAGAGITDIGLVRLSTKCTQIMKLNLRKCKRVSDSGLGFLSDRCSALQWIDLSLSSRRVTEDGISSLAEGCNNLKFVAVSGCSWITEDFIDEMEDDRGIRVFDDGGLYEEQEEEEDEDNQPI